MADEQSPSPNMTGQTEVAPWSQGQAESVPASQEGQAPAPQSQDSGQGEQATQTTDPTFFDPNNIPPELIPAYKQMQGAFTVKTQEIARQKQKVEAYDAFMRDPVGQIQQLAAQYGMQLTRAQAQQVQDQQTQQQNANWEPQTWDELLTKAEERAEQRVLQRLQPYLGQVQQMQATNIEKQLASIDPEWRNYENNMRDLLTEHPTLVKDVGKLYRLAVPPEVLEARAIQTALKKYEEKGKHAAVSPGGSAPRGKPQPAKVNSFDEAYRAAKQQILSGE